MSAVMFYDPRGRQDIPHNFLSFFHSLQATPEATHMGGNSIPLLCQKMHPILAKLSPNTPPSAGGIKKTMKTAGATIPGSIWRSESYLGDCRAKVRVILA